MADDDDDLNDFKLPPHSNEGAEAQLDGKALKLVTEYVGSLTRSKNENTIRADIRENIVKLGINGLAFQHELTAQKIMDREDRADYMRGRKRMARVFASEEGIGLLKAEQEALKARKAKKRDKENRAAIKAKGESPEQQERRIAADSNPRNDPKSGGAGKKPRKTAAQAAADRAEDAADRAGKLREVQDQSPGAAPGGRPTEAELSAAAANAPGAQDAEQAEGDAVLSGHIETMKEGATPKSQSQIAQEKLDAAMSPGGKPN